jgi:hypothetical protein
MSELFDKIRIKAEEVSGAVTEAAGEVKQAMTEAATQELKSVGEDKLLENANAISKNRAVFEEAGYVVCGMEMELGLNPRVIAHFRRHTEVPLRKQELLVAELEKKPPAEGNLVVLMLKSLLKVQTMENRVHLDQLALAEVTLEVGIPPSARITWREQAGVKNAVAQVVPKMKSDQA